MIVVYKDNKKKAQVETILYIYIFCIIAERE